MSLSNITSNGELVESFDYKGIVVHGTCQKLYPQMS